MLPNLSGERADLRVTMLTHAFQGRRPLLLGEAPRVHGAPPFAQGTVARTELARLLGIPEPQLEMWLELDNVLVNVFPALKGGDFRRMEGDVPPRD